MHINTFDHYQTIESPIHRADPRLKVVVTVVIILSNVLLPDGAWRAFVLSWGLVLLISTLARLSPKYILTRSLVALPFALVAVTAIFSLPGKPIWQIDLGPWHLIASETGLIRFFSILVRSWLSLQAAIIMTATTQFPDLIHALRHLRIPDILVSTISFMYRYLFVLSDEVMSLIRARQARSAQGLGTKKSGGSIFWRAKIAGNMAGQLFLRSYERSERVYNAMLARGYDGNLRTLKPHEMQARDWFFGAVAFLLIVFIQLIGRL